MGFFLAIPIILIVTTATVVTVLWDYIWYAVEFIIKIPKILIDFLSGASYLIPGNLIVVTVAIFMVCFGVFIAKTIFSAVKAMV